MNKNRMKIKAVQNFFKNHQFDKNKEIYEYTNIVLSGKEWKKVLINWGGDFDWSIPDIAGTFIEVPRINNNSKYRLATWVVNGRLKPVLLTVSKKRPTLPRRRRRQGLRVLKRDERRGD